eukprot:9647896-Lingulodinium_polyedra.AAC.1
MAPRTTRPLPARSRGGPSVRVRHARHGMADGLRIAASPTGSGRQPGAARKLRRCNLRGAQCLRPR